MADDAAAKDDAADGKGGTGPRTIAKRRSQRCRDSSGRRGLSDPARRRLCRTGFGGKGDRIVRSFFGGGCRDGFTRGRSFFGGGCRDGFARGRSFFGGGGTLFEFDVKQEALTGLKFDDFFEGFVAGLFEEDLDGSAGRDGEGQRAGGKSGSEAAIDGEIDVGKRNLELELGFGDAGEGESNHAGDLSSGDGFLRNLFKGLRHWVDVLSEVVEGFVESDDAVAVAVGLALKGLHQDVGEETVSPLAESGVFDGFLMLLGCGDHHATIAFEVFGVDILFLETSKTLTAFAAVTGIQKEDDPLALEATEFGFEGVGGESSRTELIRQSIVDAEVTLLLDNGTMPRKKDH